MMKKFSILFFLASTFQISAQDVSFDQSNSSLIMLNPSFAGSNGGLRFQASERAFAPSYSTRSITGQIAFDGYVKSLKGGVFASFVNDNFANGLIVNSAYNVGYAYHLNLVSNKLKLIPSVQVGYLSQKYDSKWLIWPGLQPPAPLLREGLDLSSGLLVQYRNVFSGGLSVFHINRPDINVNGPSQLERKIQLNGAYTLRISDKRLLQFMALYSRQSYYQYVKLNGILVLNYFMAGLGISPNQAYFASMGFRQDYFTAQVSYALWGSKVSPNYANVWELHLSANIRNKVHQHVLTNIENW